MLLLLRFKVDTHTLIYAGLKLGLAIPVSTDVRPEHGQLIMSALGQIGFCFVFVFVCFWFVFVYLF